MLLIQEKRKTVSVMTDEELTEGLIREVNLGKQFEGVDICDNEIRNKVKLSGSQLYASFLNDEHALIKNEMLSKINNMLGSWKQVNYSQVQMIRNFIYNTKKNYKLVYALYQPLQYDLFFFVLSDESDDECSIIMNSSVDVHQQRHTFFKAANKEFLKSVFPCPEEIIADFIELNEMPVDSSKTQLKMVI